MTGKVRDITFMIAFYLLGALCSAGAVSKYYQKKYDHYEKSVAWCEDINNKRTDKEFTLKWWCEERMEDAKETNSSTPH